MIDNPQFQKILRFYGLYSWVQFRVGPFSSPATLWALSPQNVNHVFTVCGKDCNGLRLQIEHSGVSHDCHLHMTLPSFYISCERSVFASGNPRASANIFTAKT